MSNDSEKFWNIIHVSRWMPRMFSFARKFSHRSRTSSGGLWILYTNRHKLVAISRLNMRAPLSSPNEKVNRYNCLKRSMSVASFSTICTSRCLSSAIFVALSFFSPCMNSCLVKQHICFASRQKASTRIGKSSGLKFRSLHSCSTPSESIEFSSFLSLYSSYSLLIALSANCDSFAGNDIPTLIRDMLKTGEQLTWLNGRFLVYETTITRFLTIVAIEVIRLWVV